ncbi:MAG: uroporphyrinogen decarboxylase family protein [Kiritimatiellae bacterium]|nr:uroporphyrinogen decarboxylase family protein [Kiritimatiellia bacterium]
MDRVSPSDRMSKLERVKATLAHQPVDRAAILEQLSYNPRVIADWTGKRIDGFNYTLDDICAVIRQTCDLAMPPVAPRGTARVSGADGFVYQHDNWNTSTVSRPFTDEVGAAAWLRRDTERLRATPFDAAAARQAYRATMLDLQRRIGDTVILNYSWTGFSSVYAAMGLEIFSFFMAEYPELMRERMQLTTAREVARIHAVADAALSPVILIPEDFATKQGPIFSPAFLKIYHYPFVRRLADAWHEHGVAALYHSDGNWRKAIPDLIACGVDGFYCLEPGCGMDIVEFKTAWPQLVWAGGVDGVDLMERGTPAQIKAEVRRHILETLALETGGMFVASSSEVNPSMPPESFRAMIEAVGEGRDFQQPTKNAQ